jgi:pyruvate carboxylase
MKSGNADVYEHAIPGGQYTNLQFQAFSLGLGDKFEEIKKMYKEANDALGDIIKVTPSSKIVGDLAQFMVQNGLNREMLVERAGELSFPKSVVEFMQGKIGQPPYGFPEPLRSRILRGKMDDVDDSRPGENLAPLDFDQLKAELEDKHGRHMRDQDVMSAALYPDVFEEFEDFREMYGPVDRLPTRIFFVGLGTAEEADITIEKGKTLHAQLLAEGELTAKGEQEVFFDMNGQMRSIFIKDKVASKEIREHPKALPGVKGSIGAPMPGDVLEIKVREGDEVQAKQTLCVLSAMKMEMAIESPINGVVKRILAEPKMKCDAGDLLFEIEGQN